MSSESEYATCLRVLQALCQEPEAVQKGTAAAQVVNQAAALLRVRKSLRRKAHRQSDRESIDNTGIRLRRAAAAAACDALAPPALAPPDQGALPAAADRETPSEPCAAAVPVEVTATPEPAPAGIILWRSRRCYVCKASYSRLHFFYDSLCTRCAAENYRRRSQCADLRGRVALVTGARLKIGFAVALKLLRAGATVLATTRFPADAQQRYEREPDYTAWAHRLHIHGLDLRNLPSLEAFADEVCAALPHLDILINNAAQTIRRPAAFYRHLMGREAVPADPESRAPLSSQVQFPQPDAVLHTGPRPLMPRDALDGSAYFPAGQLDRDGQPVDLRPENSWTLRLAEVSNAELLEVHAVNCIAPFILMRRMQPLLARSPHPHRFIVNVSSMEGAFSVQQKSSRHPHTNMAKAALNMLTYTCAGDLAARGIFVNSVDTGWVTNEFPWSMAQRMEAAGFQPPLDEIDGAARVCEPIFTGLDTGAPVFGQFLKDYRAAAW